MPNVSRNDVALGFRREAFQTNQHNAGTRETLAINKLAEILITGEQEAFSFVGSSKNIFVTAT